MRLRFRKPLKVFARGSSLRRRVAYSLAIVRLILVPVIALAIYYLFAMSWIVDRIVSVDAPAATLAERASIEMMDARRAERNYFLLHDPEDLQANRQAVAQLRDLVSSIRDLQPEEQATTQKILSDAELYENQMAVAVARLGGPGQTPVGRLQAVIAAYEHNLNQILRRANREDRGRLIDELRTQVGSFDAQIADTLEAQDPALRETVNSLRTTSDEILQLSSDLEQRSWKRVQHDHQEARALRRRAEWVISIVSILVFLLSVWVSFVLPREVVRPMMELKAAVDHAAAGNYEIEFDVQGEGEVVQLANSVRELIDHVREKTMHPVGKT